MGQLDQSFEDFFATTDDQDKTKPVDPGPGGAKGDQPTK